VFLGIYGGHKYVAQLGLTLLYIMISYGCAGSSYSATRQYLPTKKARSGINQTGL